MIATDSVLLDTTIVVDHFRGKDFSIAQKLKEARTRYMPLTVLGELLFGAYRSSFQAKLLTQINEFLKDCEVLELSERTADIYGQLKADLSRKGNLIPEMIYGLRRWPWNTNCR